MRGLYCDAEDPLPTSSGRHCKDDDGSCRDLLESSPPGAEHTGGTGPVLSLQSDAGGGRGVLGGPQPETQQVRWTACHAGGRSLVLVESCNAGGIARPLQMGDVRRTDSGHLSQRVASKKSAPGIL